MPELPEVETTKNGILPHLKDHTILSVEVLNPKLRWPVSEEIVTAKDLVVTDVTRRAKYLLIHTKDGGHIIIHLGMSGSLRISEASEPLKKHDHLIFSLSSGKQMRYHDPRRFGCVLWSTGEILQHSLLKKLGPEPLSEEFSKEYFIASADLRKASIKQHIMNGNIVVGVGNIYACEALFMSGISPKRLAKNISKHRLELLRSSIQQVLQRSIEQGGTTLKDFINSDGQPGYFKQQLTVYGKEGEPCSTCSTKIKRSIIGQRSTFYCPKCQK